MTVAVVDFRVVGEDTLQGEKTVATTVGRSQLEEYYLPSLPGGALNSESLGGLVFTLSASRSQGVFVELRKSPCCMEDLRFSYEETGFNEVWLTCSGCQAFTPPQRYLQNLFLAPGQIGPNSLVDALAAIVGDFQDPLAATMTAMELVRIFHEIY